MGSTWNARRDQSMEMAKDFQKHCPDVRVTLAQNNADYTVVLNHIEVGLFVRDNQMEVANKDGDLLDAGNKGGIKGGVKGACAIIVADWRTHQTLPPSPPITPPTPASTVAPPTPATSVVVPVSSPASQPPAPVAKSEPPPAPAVETKQKTAYECTEYTVDRLGLKNCTKWVFK